MKNMNKAKYFAPEVEFICIRSSEDILAGSFNNPDDEYEENFGIVFPY